MIYNENGESLILYENKLVLLEDARSDLDKKQKEIEKFLEEIAQNNDELKNVKELNLDQINKIKKNIKKINIAINIWEKILGVSFIALPVTFIIKVFFHKWIPLLISFLSFFISGFITTRQHLKWSSVNSQLSKEIDSIMNKSISLLNKIKSKNNDVSISKEGVDALQKLEKLKKEKDQILKNIDKEDINNTDKDIQKYVKEYDLLNKLKKFIADERNEDISEVDIRFYKTEADYGYMIGVVLSTEEIDDDTIIVECVLYGDDSGPYVGEKLKEYYTFKNSSGVVFDIKFDKKSAYSYKHKKYIDDTDDAGFGDGLYRFVFNIKDKNIGFKEGSIFYYRYGF